VTVAPVETPQDGGPIAGNDHLLGLEARVRRLGEERLPELAHRPLAHVPLTIGRRQRVLENAVVGHQRHHTVDVMAAECLVEGLDRGSCIVRAQA
jgi:hypothetical protein